MKKQIFTRTLAAATVALAVLLPAAAQKKAAKQKVQTIIVGTGTNMKRYCYLDDDGNLAGYEKDVLDAIDALLPQYKFKYETFDFKNILLSLSAGKIDIGAHQFELNPERRKNYLFTEQGYNSYTKYIVVLKTRNDINSFEDLAGKTATAWTGTNTAAILNHYNEEAPDDKKIKTILTSGETKEQLVAAMKNGTYDAYFAVRSDVDADNRDYGDLFKIVGEPISTSAAYFLFSKKNPQLKADVDAALKQLRESGELAKIAIKDLGGDYTQD
ncbi:MAG: transporter substrate-binding domain-containing protein [Treponema sp.]|nr:transporter substrate-binding domain-containing protein [Treponema sp.]